MFLSDAVIDIMKWVGMGWDSLDGLGWEDWGVMGRDKIGKGGMKWDGMAWDKIDWNGIGRGGIRWVWERCLFTVSSSSYFKKEIMFRFQIAEGYKNDKELPDFPFTCPFLPANTIHAKASRLCLRLQALSLVGISSFTEYSLRAGSPLGHTREGRSRYQLAGYFWCC